VLYVDEGCYPTLLLSLGDHLQSDGGFTGRFRPEDFDDAAARQAADAQGSVQRNRTGRDHRNRYDGIFRPETQNRAFAKLLFNLAQSKVQGSRPLFFVHGVKLLRRG
jgi:hypothetical protein